MNNSQKKLSDFYTNKNFLLKKSLEQFAEKTKFFPQIGIELEFYLLDQNSQHLENQALIEDYIDLLMQIFLQDSTIYKIEKEQGASQIEIKIAPHSDLILLSQKVEKIKFAAKNLAQKNNLIACFEAQPFVDDCGSALQFNFSLHDIDGKNLFAENDDEQNKAEQNLFASQKNIADENKLMMSAIAGMLDSIEQAMIFYAPQARDYLRFDLEINRALHKKGKFTAPVNISFGENNRTAAIRIPHIKKSHNNFFSAQEKLGNHRIEFRVATADADPFLAIASLLIAMPHAINNQAIPQDSQKIFGNAFDVQYSLKEFAKNLQIAEEIFFAEENFIRKNFENL